MSKDKHETKHSHDQRVHHEVTKEVLAPGHKGAHTSEADVEASKEMEQPPFVLSDSEWRTLEDTGRASLAARAQENADREAKENSAWKGVGEMAEKARRESRVPAPVAPGDVHLVFRVFDPAEKMFAVCRSGCGRLPMSDPSAFPGFLARFDEMLVKSNQPNAKHHAG